MCTSNECPYDAFYSELLQKHLSFIEALVLFIMLQNVIRISNFE